MTTTFKRRILLLFSIPFCLLIPLLVMQFTAEVDWSGFDFLVMSLFLLGLGLGVELVLSRVSSRRQQVLLLLLLLLVFFLVWAELAVGLFGTALAGS